MNCLNPIKIIVDNHEQEFEKPFVYVPCGKCECCRNSDSMSWRIRLQEHFFSSSSAYFVTLTYDDSCLHFEQCFSDGKFYGFHPVVNKQDVQKFFKRLREHFKPFMSEGEKISYFLVSEYGPTTYRPHYHFIIFNLPKLSSVSEVNDYKIKTSIQKIWHNGFVVVDKCNENRIAYCTKYMSCQTVLPKYLPKPFRLISKGIGRSYLSKIDRLKWHKLGLNNYYPDGNYKKKLPRYYKDKIFSDDEKLMIRQLFILRQEDDNFNPRSNKQDNHKAVTRIKKIKRDYLKKSLKNRKDI